MELESHLRKNKYFNNLQHSKWNAKLPAWIHLSRGIRNASGIYARFPYVSCRGFKWADALMSF